MTRSSVLKATLVVGMLGLTTHASANLLITGVIDGPLTGGVPKGIELYALADIADLSIYGVGSANNGGGSDGEEFTLSGAASAGDYIYIGSNEQSWIDFFGITPDFTSGSMSINGDDAIELFMNGSVIDTYGDINVLGDGEPWDYTDGWAYRNDGTFAGAFDDTEWSYSGINALDGETDNGSAATPFPIGTYNPIPAPGALALLAIAGVAGRRRRR